MSLYQVVNGNTIYSGDINQLVNTLSQPSGGVENGRYRLAGAAYTSGAVISVWLTSLSRNGAPVSVGADTTDQSPVNLNAPTIPLANANWGGMLIYSTSTGASTNCYCAGHYNLNY